MRWPTRSTASLRREKQLTNASIQSRRVRFDELATLVSDRVDNPAESGVERYVGLEHLEADSLRIRQWGEITDVESTKLRFRPGDIIFGKRRVYQRKLAVADFEGICSAHAMVLRAKPEAVHPQFLPYFMQSDMFMERALAISVGSLSPTINWRDLAQQEFRLPPIEQQRRVADLCASLAASATACQSTMDCCVIAIRSRSARLRDENLRFSSAPLRSLLRECKAGQWGEEPGQSGVDVSVVRSTDLDANGVLHFETAALRSLPTAILARHQLAEGDVLLEKSGGGPEQPVGRVGLLRSLAKAERPMVCANFMQMLRADPTVCDSRWLFWVLFGLHSARWTLRHQTQTTGIRNLSVSAYLAEPFPIPDLEVQRRQADELDAAEQCRINLGARHARHRALLGEVLRTLV